LELGERNIAQENQTPTTLQLEFSKVYIYIIARESRAPSPKVRAPEIKTTEKGGGARQVLRPQRLRYDIQWTLQWIPPKNEGSKFSPRKYQVVEQSARMDWIPSESRNLTRNSTGVIDFTVRQQVAPVPYAHVMV
jgi:hypothetical protein